jgi:uncharacterized membrane protein YecN with MAPEG domain
MMILPVTLGTAALSVVVNIWLGWRVVTARRVANVRIGDGGDEGVLRRMRAHANFAENTPIFLILIAAIELAVGNGLLLVMLAAIFLAARIAHGIGMDGGSLVRFRMFGMMATTLTTLVLAVWATLLAIRGF